MICDFHQRHSEDTSCVCHLLKTYTVKATSLVQETIEIHAINKQAAIIHLKSLKDIYHKIEMKTLKEEK